MLPWATWSSIPDPGTKVPSLCSSPLNSIYRNNIDFNFIMWNSIYFKFSSFWQFQKLFFKLWFVTLCSTFSIILFSGHHWKLSLPVFPGSKPWRWQKTMHITQTWEMNGETGKLRGHRRGRGRTVCTKPLLSLKKLRGVAHGQPLVSTHPCSSIPASHPASRGMGETSPLLFWAENHCHRHARNWLRQKMSPPVRLKCSLSLSVLSIWGVTPLSSQLVMS